MKLRVFTENPLTIMEYKRIIELAKTSKSLKPDILKMFPDRCKDVLHKGNNSIIIYMDKKDATAHKYETKFD